MRRITQPGRVLLSALLVLLLAVSVAVAEPAEESAGVDVLSGTLPMLVNKSSPVDEDFVPADLVLLTDVLDSSIVTVKYKSTQGVREAVEALERMLEAAEADGIKKWQISAGYRSIQDQKDTLYAKINYYLDKNPSWSQSRARSASLQTVAEPGCSEHHLGLAFDINVPGTSFKGTKQCKWLHAHCWDYGFIVRYTEGKEKKTGFRAEPWHIRYVGVDHALIIRDNDLCLEEYIEGVLNGEIAPPVVVEDDDEFFILPEETE